MNSTFLSLTGGIFAGIMAIVIYEGARHAGKD